MSAKGESMSTISEKRESSEEWANKENEYNPQKLRDLLDGKFEPLFENDEKFEDYMKILEESRLAQVPKS